MRRPLRLSQIIFLLIALGPAAAKAQAVASSRCAELMSSLAKRPLSRVTSLNIMSYNLRDMQLWSSGRKPEVEVAAIGVIIAKSNADIVVVQEADRQSLQHLNRTYLYNEYQIVTADRGNDPAGRQIAFLVKRDLPFNFTLESHAHMTNYNGNTRRDDKIFTRDLPTLLVRTNANALPFLAVFGVHAKSDDPTLMKDNDNPNARIRAAEFAAAARLDTGYVRKYGPDLHRIFAGDFNTNVFTAPEMAPLAQREFVDSRALFYANTPQRTAAVKPRIDSLQISPGLQSRVVAAGRLPLPAELDRLKIKPSDHDPELLIIKADNLWKTDKTRGREGSREKETGTN